MGEADDRLATSGSDTELDEHLRVVESLLRAGRGPAALDVAQALAACWPERAEPRILLGRAHQSVGRIDEATRAAADAVALAPRHPAARMLDRKSVV